MNNLQVNFYIIVAVTVALFISYEKAYADSPTFSRQEISDYASDWYALNQTEDYFSNDARLSYVYSNKLFHAENVSDISSITASSNGKMLNVTFWITDAFNEHPKKTAPQYYIRFDADSDLLTGDRFGADYLFHVSWNNDTQLWEQIFQEYSPKNHVRVLQSNNNYTKFYSKLDSNIIGGKKNQSDYLDCCYVSFPIDLNLMNYPNNYAMSFHIIDSIYVNQTMTGVDKLKKPITLHFNGVVEFLDSTADVSVPTPTFEFATESQKINLTHVRKSVPIVINSISEAPALIGLSVNNKTFPAKFISFIPNKAQLIEPHGRAKFDLVYNGDITNTSSFLLPIDQSVYQRIYGDKPNEVTYSLVCMAANWMACSLSIF